MFFLAFFVLFFPYVIILFYLHYLSFSFYSFRLCLFASFPADRNASEHVTPSLALPREVATKTCAEDQYVR
jgi:hypothetical protein